MTRTLAVMAWAIALAGMDLAGATRVHAEADFTFRRVGVPQAGTRGRINVQIDPTVQRRSAPSTGSDPNRNEQDAAAPETETASAAVPVPPASGYEWFWLAVSPRLADSGPGRLELALRAMAAAPAGGSVAAPRVQSLQDIAATHGIEILRATVGTRVSPALALAVISVESGGRPTAVSSAGASGLMQLMPATAERFGVTDRNDPGQSIRGGVAYLDWLLGHFDGDPILAIAGYNAGEGAVRDNAGVPPYAETRAYVPKVLAAWSVARGLCQTPPVLIGDGCVFTINNL